MTTRPTTTPTTTRQDTTMNSTPIHYLTDTNSGTRTACEGEGPMTVHGPAVTCPDCLRLLTVVHDTDDAEEAPRCGATVWGKASVFAGDITCADCLTVDGAVHYAVDGENVYAVGEPVHPTACEYPAEYPSAHVHTACGLDASGGDREVPMSDHPTEVTCRTCIAGGLPDVHAVGDGDDTLCGESADDNPTDADDDAVTCEDCRALIRERTQPVPVSPKVGGRHAREDLTVTDRIYLSALLDVDGGEHAADYGLTDADLTALTVKLT